MEKKIYKTKEIDNKGLEQVFDVIEHYGKAFIVNEKTNKTYMVIEGDGSKQLASILSSLKKIKSILFEKYNIEQIGVFGSYARGDNTNASDIDILVDKVPRDIGVYAEVYDFISSSLNFENIDLISMATIKDVIKDEVFKEVIYA